MGDDHVGGVDHHAGVAHADRHLAAQRFEAGAEHVAEGARAVEAGDLGQLLVQRTDREVVHMGHGGAQGEHAFTAGFGEHLVDDAGAGDQARPLDPGDIRGGGGQRRGLVHVEAGLRARADQPLVLQVGVGLQHRGVADIELRAHLAHRGHTFARLVDTTADVFGQLLGDALIEQQIGHGGGTWFTGPKQYRSSNELHRYSTGNCGPYSALSPVTVSLQSAVTPLLGAAVRAIKNPGSRSRRGSWNSGDQRGAPSLPFSSENTISTRRFCARPWDEAFSATGKASP